MTTVSLANRWVSRSLGRGSRNPLEASPRADTPSAVDALLPSLGWVLGLGFGVWGSGFMVWGLGFWVRGLGFGIHGLSYGV